MNYKPQAGDIFLNDSNKLGAKIVKFLQQSPTIYSQIYRFFTHKLEPVRYYHAGMVYSESQIIEQQWKVQLDDLNKILSRRIIIYRFKPFASHESQRTLVKARALEDLDKIYDIPQLIGKTLSWLTGIKLFVRLLGAFSKEQEICVTRIGDWFEGLCDFGVKTKHEITTKIIDEYCQAHPEKWETIYQNG